MSRSRTRITRESHGSSIGTGSITWNIHQVSQDTDVCVDDLHPWVPKRGYIDDGPLLIERFDRSGFTPVNGVQTTMLGTHTIKDFIPDFVAGTGHAHAFVDGSIQTPGQLALRVLANTNPNRGEADLGEDLLNPLGSPLKKIRRDGNSVLGELADIHLWTVFGLFPFIDDLKKLSDHQRLLERRMREMSSLFMNGGLHRKLNLGQYAYQNTEDRYIHTNSFSIQSRIVTSTTLRQWGTVRWFPIDGNPWLGLTGDERIGRVRRMVYGLDFDRPETLYKLLPWSWLIGWFTDFNLRMKAKKGGFPVLPSNVCIMRHWESTIKFTTLAKTAWISGGSGSIRRITKQRLVVPSGGLPIAHIPWPNLGFGKSAILGSLASQRLDYGDLIDRIRRVVGPRR